MEEHPTLLWHPTANGTRNYVETVLPLPPQDYHAIQVRDWWIVIVIATGEKVYEGTGPVKVYRSPVPVAPRHPSC